MKYKKSINAKDFIPQSDPRAALPAYSPHSTIFVDKKQHNFLSKIYKGKSSHATHSRYDAHCTIDTKNNIMEHRRSLQNNSPFMITSMEVKNGEEQEQIGEKFEPSDLVGGSVEAKGKNYSARVKHKNIFQEAKVKQFYARFSTTKLFHPEETLSSPDKTLQNPSIFNISRSSMEKQKERLNPYQLAVRKKNIKLIQLKINSLGEKADESEKKIYHELAEGLEHESVKLLKKNRNLKGSISKQRTKTIANLWHRYSYERNKSQSQEEESKHTKTIDHPSVHLLEPISTSVPLSSLPRTINRNRKVKVAVKKQKPM